RMKSGSPLASPAHHLFIDRQAPCRVDDENVHVTRARELYRPPRDIGRLLARLRSDELGAGLAGDRLQLFDGRRAIDVGRYHRDLLALILQEERELAARGGLAGA